MDGWNTLRTERAAMIGSEPVNPSCPPSLCLLVLYFKIWPENPCRSLFSLLPKPSPICEQLHNSINVFFCCAVAAQIGSQAEQLFFGR